MSEVVNPNADMPRYVCHKVVSALKVRAEVRAGDAPWENTGSEVILIPLDHRFKEIRVSNTWARARNVDRVGYFVVYEDGYTSWSPVEAFDHGYTPEEAYRQLADAASAASEPWVNPASSADARLARDTIMLMERMEKQLTADPGSYMASTYRALLSQRFDLERLAR